MDVAIRPYQADDVDALYEAAVESIEDLHPWLPWCHPGYRIDETREWLGARPAARAAGSELDFAVVAADGRLLGGCGLSAIDRLHRFANLGYWVRSSAAGMGVAPAAVQALVAWAFAQTDLERLEILVAADNRRSQRVAEKVGARHEGRLARRLSIHDRFHDANLYAIVRTKGNGSPQPR